MLLSTVIFAVVLILLFTETFDRTKVVLVAAALSILVGAISQSEALEAIDFATIGLLAGMMIIAHQTQRSGLYDYLAIRVGQLSKARPFRLTVYLCLLTAVLSAFLDNLTTILLVVPITFTLAGRLKIDPLPLIVAEVIAANIGGTATLIGDPPNILIAGATGLSFWDFLNNLGPIAAVVLVLAISSTYALYRKRLALVESHRQELMALDAKASITDKRLLIFDLIVLAAVLTGFFLHDSLGLEPATVALSGAALLLLFSRRPLEKVLEHVEWSTLFFFLAFFVLVGSLEVNGVLERLAELVTEVTEGSFATTVIGIAWTSAIASALVDNIPFTTTMIPVIQDLQRITNNDSNTYWWALSLATGFGGNATIVAAAANLMAVGLAKRAGHPISFLAFLKVGLPVAVLSMIAATIYLQLRYL